MTTPSDLEKERKSSWSAEGAVVVRASQLRHRSLVDDSTQGSDGEDLEVSTTCRY